MNPSQGRQVDPLGSSGPIHLAGYRMHWQLEVDCCIITIALMQWLSVRETLTKVTVFLYALVYLYFYIYLRVNCIFAYI